MDAAAFTNSTSSTDHAFVDEMRQQEDTNGGGDSAIEKDSLSALKNIQEK